MKAIKEINENPLFYYHHLINLAKSKKVIGDSCVSKVFLRRNDFGHRNLHFLKVREEDMICQASSNAASTKMVN